MMINNYTILKIYKNKFLEISQEINLKKYKK